MIEPELLRTLERLENEEFLEVATPELPLPSAAGGDDYFSILEDLRSALGDTEELTKEPETSFADPQNILELDASQEFENELELLPEASGFDFPNEETGEALSNFELKLPDEVPPQTETNAAVESRSFEQFSNESEALPADSETANFESFAAPESLATFVNFAAEPVHPEPEITEETGSLPLEDFLSTQKFSSEPQTADSEISEDSFDSQTKDSSFKFEPPEFFNEFDFEETTESGSIFDSVVDTNKVSSPTGFDFVPGAEETEFPEILHDEETDEFAGEDFAPKETLSSESVSDFQTDSETESFASEIEDFSDFLPAETKDFLSDLDREPELPQFKAPQNSFETLPEPSLTDEIEENAQSRRPFVVFKIDAKYFAFPASKVAEIGHEPQFTALPFVPSWFSGVTNLRGDVIAVLDLRGLWEMPAAAPDARRKMLVVHSEKENLTVGLLVDGVSEIRYLGESEINSAEGFSGEPFAFCVNGGSRTNETAMPILDVERFLASPKLRRL